MMLVVSEQLIGKLVKQDGESEIDKINESWAKLKGRRGAVVCFSSSPRKTHLLDKLNNCRWSGDLLHPSHSLDPFDN